MIEISIYDFEEIYYQIRKKHNIDWNKYKNKSPRLICEYTKFKPSEAGTDIPQKTELNYLYIVVVIN